MVVVRHPGVGSSVMDSNLEDEQYMGEVSPQDEGIYGKKEELIRKRCPATRPGNYNYNNSGGGGGAAGRAKRVVSCKRKTHRLVVARRKAAAVAAGRPGATGNKENEVARRAGPGARPEDAAGRERFHADPWEFPLNVNKRRGGGTGSEHTDGCSLGELTRDHGSMVNVLFGRNLRLRVASTLWQRNVGELLTYFLRMEDTGVIFDFLPIITQSIDEDSSGFTIGCCVDLFPLVKKVLSSPYEEYVAVGLKWIHSVLKKWLEELRASGLTGRATKTLDKNYQVFNQQLASLWHQDPGSTLVQEMPPDLAKVIDSYLSQLT